jgi:hypothetical protein
MALVRCKSCGIDTSDSLERCPICGGSPSGRQLASVVAAATEAASRAADGGDKARAAAQALSQLSRQLPRVPGVVWVVAGLVLLAAVPHVLPILFVLAILWMFGRGRRASHETQRSMESEVLKVFKNRAPAAKQSAAGRPLERLRAIEQATLERDA